MSARAVGKKTGATRPTNIM